MRLEIVENYAATWAIHPDNQTEMEVVAEEVHYTLPYHFTSNTMSYTQGKVIIRMRAGA